MKITLIILFCLLVFTSKTLAQTQAEKLFQTTLAEYQKNPMKSILERASDNYVLVTGSGYVIDKAKTAAIFKNVSNVEVSFKDLNVRQFGSTVIVSGAEHSVRHYNNGTPDTAADYLSTYVYEIKNNQLVYLSGHHTNILVDSNPVEEEAIKRLLRQETIDVYAAEDVNAYFLDSPKTFRAWNTRTGYSVEYGYEQIKKKNDESFGNRPRDMNPINENYTFKFYGPYAVVVTYDQYLYGKEQTPSKEIRVLEKINNSWKIAGIVALWDYSCNSFEQGNVKKTIETETNAYHAGDIEAMNKQWAMKTNYVERQQAYLKTLGVSPYLKGNQLKAFGERVKQSHKPTGQTYKISDYEAHIGTTNAWVTYTQEVFNADGKLANKTREMRILERLDGWKIVAMSNLEL